MMQQRNHKQLSIAGFIRLICRLRIPWLWIAITFCVNLLYNKLLYDIPVSTGRLLNGDLSSEALRETVLYYVLYALIVVIQAAILAYTTAVTAKNARSCLWGKMLQIREDYYDSIDSSEMISTITQDLASAVPRYINLLVAVLPDIIYVIFATKTITGYDISLLLTMMAFLPVKYLYMLFIGRRLFRLEAGIRDQIGTLTATLGERMQNLQLVKTFNREADELEKGKEDIKVLYHANVRYARLSGLTTAMESAIDLLQQFACMVVAILMMRKGRIDMGQWITFFLFFTSINSKFSALISDWFDLKIATGSLERTNRMMNAPVENETEEGLSTASAEDVSLEFRDVTFSYDGDLALNKVSFVIPQGKKTAIVGTCGSGKSTILALMERFYAPQSGEITMGGIPIDKFRLEDYRSLMAYVPQNNQVFSSKLREALCYGNSREFTDEELLAAAEKTRFSDYIALQSEGLDAPVHNGGEGMSGGQRQRMVITREILRSSKIVLFDEPTSALDAESSENIKNLIMDNLEDKTVVVVTHDLGMTEGMDQIILLHDGEFLASGSFETLMETSSEFRSMVESQRMQGEMVS